MRGIAVALISVLLSLAAVACGSTSHSSTPAAAPATSTSSSAESRGSQGGVGALSAEAQSAATGDIPDNQVFLAFGDSRSGYSISYPEGWARKGAGSKVTFSDKNNIVRIVIGKGAAPSPATVRSELSMLQRGNATLAFSPPHPVHVKSGTAIKATYTTRSAPNPVTGKQVQLVVDRYELARAGRWATVDLGTPKGVDNVDAYRMMINSFSWR